MENKVVRVSVGADIAKDTFYSAIIYLMEDQTIKCKGTRKFSNTGQGFADFIAWVERKVKEDRPVSFTMESTGVYYENLACFLYDRDQRIHVVLPNKAKKFSESLDNKSKTDKLDAKTLGRMGAERTLKAWDPGSKIFQRLKKLTREREAIQKARTREQNMLHAEKHSAFSEVICRDRIQERLELLNTQLKSVEKDIDNTIESDDEVHRKVKQIESIKGMSTTTIAVVIAETYGFATFTNLKQLTSFAGYDIVQRESGKYSGKTRISKKGNSHIRRALYMPSLSAIQHSETYKKFYNKLNERKDNGLISGTAVQRKLLGLIFSLWKNDTVFMDNYQG